MSNPPTPATVVSQKRFLDFHHHLINPCLYTAQQIDQRNRALLEANWKKNTSLYDSALSQSVEILTPDRPAG